MGKNNDQHRQFLNPKELSFHLGALNINHMNLFLDT
jgi:hypothetical protein